ncbi:MAG: hypothetical protein KDJ77_07350 [Rhodobiaceae bacterium]|nr:hypothetical protein [Rhodobiaceae bacterium]
MGVGRVLLRSSAILGALIMIADLFVLFSGVVINRGIFENQIYNYLLSFAVFIAVGFGIIIDNDKRRKILGQKTFTTFVGTPIMLYVFCYVAVIYGVPAISLYLKNGNGAYRYHVEDIGHVSRFCNSGIELREALIFARKICGLDGESLSKLKVGNLVCVVGKKNQFGIRPEKIYLSSSGQRCFEE